MGIVSLMPPNSYIEDWDLKEMEFQDGSKVKNPFDLTTESEARESSTRDHSNQRNWLMPRLLVHEAQTAIVDDIFSFDGRSVAEFGCGVAGWFYNFMLPKRKNWRQFDISPWVVKENKRFSRKFLRRFPNVAIGNMYDMPLKDESLDVVFGVSSWDSIYFLNKSAEETKRVLRPGGYFVHLQDLMPADGPLLLMEAQKRKERGMATKFPVRFIVEKIDKDFGYSIMRYVFGIDSIDWGEVRLGQYLNNELRKTFEQNGFNIEKLGGIEKEVLVDETKFNQRLKKITKKSWAHLPNSLGFAYGKHITKNDNTIPNGQKKQYAYMDIIVAQKSTA